MLLDTAGHAAVAIALLSVLYVYITYICSLMLVCLSLRHSAISPSCLSFCRFAHLGNEIHRLVPVPFRCLGYDAMWCGVLVCGVRLGPRRGELDNRGEDCVAVQGLRAQPHGRAWNLSGRKVSRALFVSAAFMHIRTPQSSCCTFGPVHYLQICYF